jgi:hypothetical protein
VIALALGAVVAGEALSNWTFFCSVIVVVAVFMIIRSKARAAQPTNGAVSYSEPQIVSPEAQISRVGPSWNLSFLDGLKS